MIGLQPVSSPLLAFKTVGKHKQGGLNGITLAWHAKGQQFESGQGTEKGLNPIQVSLLLDLTGISVCSSCYHLIQTVTESKNYQFCKYSILPWTRTRMHTSGLDPLVRKLHFSTNKSFYISIFCVVMDWSFYPKYILLNHAKLQDIPQKCKYSWVFVCLSWELILFS